MINQNSTLKEEPKPEIKERISSAFEEMLKEHNIIRKSCCFCGSNFMFQKKVIKNAKDSVLFCSICHKDLKGNKHV